MEARELREESCKNRWNMLRSRVMRSEGEREAAHSRRREAQQGVKCWGCGEAVHCLWVCPKKAVHPTRGKAQQKEVRRAVEGKEVVSRKWHWNERKAERGGYLVERRERGWIERRRGGGWCTVSLVTCGYYGEEGTNEGENFVKQDCVHDMWCEKCGLKREWLDREVATGRKSKMRCTACGKKWVAAKKMEVEVGECNKCEDKRRRKEAAQPREVKTQQEEKEGEKDLRCTLWPLNEVWMTIGMEKVDTHEGVTVKALLDSGATGMFADRKFVEKNGFKLERLERAV